MYLECVSHYKTHLRHALRVHITDLIAVRGPYSTNMRRAKGHTSLITKMDGVTVALIRDAPY
jgi:hypothetical protein